METGSCSIRSQKSIKPALLLVIGPGPIERENAVRRPNVGIDHQSAMAISDRLEQGVAMLHSSPLFNGILTTETKFGRLTGREGPLGMDSVPVLHVGFGDERTPQSVKADRVQSTPAVPVGS